MKPKRPHNLAEFGLQLHPQVAGRFAVLMANLKSGEVPSDLQFKLASLRNEVPAERELKRLTPRLLSALVAHLRGHYKKLTPEFVFHAAYALGYVAEEFDTNPDHELHGFIDDCRVVTAVAEIVRPEMDEFRLWVARASVA
jgi:uncharacterized membrane protein YkvA (DUF1232 family)